MFDSTGGGIHPSAIIGHGARLEGNCEIAPAAVIGSNCVIGDRVRVGLNATLLPGVRVGDRARIAAGAVVVKDVPAGEIWAGNPAKCIRDVPTDLVSRDGVTVARLTSA